MTDFLYLPDVRTDQAEWAKVRRQQPAFVALLEAAEAGFAVCEWDAERDPGRHR